MKPPPIEAVRPLYKHDAIFCFLATLPTFAALVPVIGASTAIHELGDSDGLRAGFLASSIAGLAAGYLFIGNLADYRGQRTVLRGSLLAFAIFSTALYFLTDSLLFLVVRFFQALSSSACMVIPQALYRDTYTGPLARRANAISLLGTALGPISAFLLGGMLDTLLSWRIGFLITAFGSVVGYVCVRYLPVNDLVRRVSSNVNPVAMKTGFKGFQVFAAVPACCFAGSYAFFVTAPLIGSQELTITASTVSFLLCLPPIGLAFGSAVAARFSSRFGIELLFGGLVLQIAASLAAAAMTLNPSFLIFAVMLLYGVANGLTVSVSTAAAIARYPGSSGAAAAVVGFIRMAGAAIGAGALVLTTHFHASSALRIALVIVAILLVSLLVPVFRRSRRDL